MSCLYILEIKPLSVASFEIFSPSLQLIFLFVASFVIQRLISLCPIRLFRLLFLLPCKTQESVATIYIRERFAYVLFYEFYDVMSCLSVLAILSFFCVCGVRVSSSFIDLHVAVQLSQHHLLKRLSFLHCMFCFLC